MRRKRRNHSPAFKAKVAMAALQGDKTLADAASHGKPSLMKCIIKICLRYKWQLN
jgi:transposase-like protein